MQSHKHCRGEKLCDESSATLPHTVAQVSNLRPSSVGVMLVIAHFFDTPRLAPM